MVHQPADPRTEDTIVFELLQSDRSGGPGEVIGLATFSDGRTSLDAPEKVAVAVRELLQRPFVDRVEADERPRGYRRSGRGIVDMLVPGMPEHFIARLRGLWLAYPDGTVVTAREGAAPAPGERAVMLDKVETGPAVADPAVRRATLAESTAILNARPLVQANEPLTGLRPADERPDLARTDCGWIC
jgi:hypothetical protein